ncbi:MAG: hypothetical protein IPQ08_05945 [Chitinophagaceae bacterium]|nr:hypothetical protein [Chitinophagaceae bacterium]
MNTKTASDSKAERFVLFDLDDVLCVKGNYIPAMLLDQFAIHLQLTNSKRVLVPAEMTAAVAAEQSTSMVVLGNVEIFIWYYPCSLDDVRAIRLAAQTLESSGVNSYGISFLTK